MANRIRLWEINSQDNVDEIASHGVDTEGDLERWLVGDISMLDPNLMVIGQQVKTAFGGKIDLLCLSSDGGLVVVELKRGKAAREAVSQAIEYASWVKDLAYDEIVRIAEREPPTMDSLEQSFRNRFGDRLPETLNESHRSLVVGESLDDGTERIVQYLSDLNVPINAVTIQYFRTEDERRILAQSFVIEPETAAARATSKGKNAYQTVREIAEIADEIGVGELYSHVKEGWPCGLSNWGGKDKVGFQVHVDGRTLSVMVVDLIESGKETGLRFRLNGNRLIEYFGLDEDGLTGVLPADVEEMPPEEWRGVPEEDKEHWKGFKGYFRSNEDVERLLTKLNAS